MVDAQRRGRCAPQGVSRFESGWAHDPPESKDSGGNATLAQLVRAAYL